MPRIATCKNPECRKEFKVGSGCLGKYCSRSCTGKMVAIRNKERATLTRIETIKTYYIFPKECEGCGESLNFSHRRNRFCSQNCSAVYNNKRRKKRSIESRNRTSNTLKDLQIKRNIEGPYTLIKLYHCIICEKDFFYIKMTSPKKTCSKGCFSRRAEESGSKAGKVSSTKRIRRSKDEIKLHDLCHAYFKKVRHNVPLAEGWDADIIIDDFNIAVMWQGIWHREQLPFGNHSLAQVQNRDKLKVGALMRAEWQVLVFHDNEYTPQKAFEAIREMVGPVGFEPTTNPFL
jgi:hypothetical protein